MDVRDLSKNIVPRVRKGFAGKLLTAAFLPILLKGAAAQQPAATLAAAKDETFERVKYIGLAALLYSVDHGAAFPRVTRPGDAFRAFRPYVKSKAKEPFRSLNPLDRRFLFNLALSGLPTKNIGQPATALLAYDEKPWPDQTRVAVFVDGHAQILTKEDWEAVSYSLDVKRVQR